MKKNVMMRMASCLLVAVLLTTCVISGTFAKYTTTADASDEARVAKWGVEITTDSDLGLFSETYEIATATNAADNSAITNSVAVSSTGTNVVAPGTSGSVNFSISGTPEVAVNVKVEMTVNKDVKISKSTTGVELTEDYCPVVFTLTKDGTTDALATGTLTDIKTAMEELSANYAPNTNLEATYTLSWEWAFNGNNDIADTYLGNVAAGTVTDANVETGIEFNFTITVTQVD
ncbi:MAG: hypothetical protein IJX55_02750 [Clostridia bacterium]|nr:hypothetical protein [Clostridia bacterium]